MIIFYIASLFAPESLLAQRSHSLLFEPYSKSKNSSSNIILVYHVYANLLSINFLLVVFKRKYWKKFLVGL